MKRCPIIANLMTRYCKANGDTSSIVVNRQLTVLSALGIAYSLPLPNLGRHQSGAAWDKVGSRKSLAVISEINEYMFFDTQSAHDLSAKIYQHRYHSAYNPQYAITEDSIKDIAATILGGEQPDQSTVALWGESFVESIEGSLEHIE